MQKKTDALEGFGWALMIGAEGSTGPRRIRLVNVETREVHDPGELGPHTGNGRLECAIQALVKYMRTGALDREALANVEQVGRRVDGGGES